MRWWVGLYTHGLVYVCIYTCVIGLSSSLLFKYTHKYTQQANKQHTSKQTTTFTINRTQHTQVLRLFNLCEIGPRKAGGGMQVHDSQTSGEPRVTARQRARMTDLSLLLDVVLKAPLGYVCRVMLGRMCVG